MLPWGPSLTPEERSLVDSWLSIQEWKWDAEGRLYARKPPGLGHIESWGRFWWFLDLQKDRMESLHNHFIIFKWCPLGVRIRKLVARAGPPPLPRESDWSKWAPG